MTKILCKNCKSVADTESNLVCDCGELKLALVEGQLRIDCKSLANTQIINDDYEITDKRIK